MFPWATVDPSISPKVARMCMSSSLSLHWMKVIYVARHRVQQACFGSSCLATRTQLQEVKNEWLRGPKTFHFPQLSLKYTAVGRVHPWQPREVGVWSEGEMGSDRMTSLSAS